MALSNQGLAKQEFRAALGFVRLAESSMTAIAYGIGGAVHAGQHRADSADPAGRGHRRADRRVADSTHPARDVPSHVHEFRRVDGRLRHLDAASRSRKSVESSAAYLVMVVVGLIDAWLLYRFFSGNTPEGQARLAKLDSVS